MTTPPDPNALAVPVPALLAFCPDCGKPAGIALRDCEENRRDFPGLRIEVMPKKEALRLWDESNCECEAATAQDNYDKHYAELQAENKELNRELEEWKLANRNLMLSVIRGLGYPVETLMVMNEARVERDIACLRTALRTAETKAGAMEEAVTDIRLCWLPYQSAPFVIGVRGDRNVWLRDDGKWTEQEDDPRASLKLGGWNPPAPSVASEKEGK